MLLRVSLLTCGSTNGATRTRCSLIVIWFTFRVTEWRVKVRARMNERDTDANQKAIDSLLNFETVKYFGAEEREARALRPLDAGLRGGGGRDRRSASPG